MKTYVFPFVALFLVAMAAPALAQNATEEYVVTRKYNIAQSGYVDLGLSVKWAAFNLGASSPEESGFKFSWGEVRPADDVEMSPDNDDLWHGYDLFAGGDPYGNPARLIRYNSDPELGVVDNKAVLDTLDDAAYIATGGVGRTPTAAEFQELLDRCTWEFIEYKGSWGAVVTGPNGAQIFLDAEGQFDHCSYYMTASRDKDSRRMISCLIGNDSFDMDSKDSIVCDRCDFFSVRAVSDKPAPVT